MAILLMAVDPDVVIGIAPVAELDVGCAILPELGNGEPVAAVGVLVTTKLIRVSPAVSMVGEAMLAGISIVGDTRK